MLDDRDGGRRPEMIVTDTSRPTAVRGYDVIRMLSRDGRPTPLGDAIAHYGRIAKTLHILRMADEPGYRHQIKAQADLQEGRHALAHKVFHGRNGQLYQNYHEGMEDQIGALGPPARWRARRARGGRGPAVAVRAAPHQHDGPLLLPTP
ncbi:Tn3 family transposase [Actinomadura rubrisoli]|uniref:Tn3 family transposase n=1 Tax=Actinomadura rubrisoli TaxID=2530368 RepID=UPI00312C9340